MLLYNFFLGYEFYKKSIIIVLSCVSHSHRSYHAKEGAKRM